MRAVLQSVVAIAASGAAVPIGAEIYNKRSFRDLEFEYCNPLHIISRGISKAMGKLCDKPVPQFILRQYSSFYGVHLDEMEKPLEEYKTMNEFFTRKLKPNIRPVDEAAPLVSPCDATVIGLGKVDKKRRVLVKGVWYRFSELLRKKFRNGEDIDTSTQVFSYDKDKVESLARLVCHDLPEANPEKEQYFCVLYLKPGDYHRIHSPCHAIWNSFTHASGSLFPMIKFLRPILPSLFSVNERVVLHGNWKYGQIDMVAVAAFGVGAITLSPVVVHTNLLRHTARVARNLRVLSPAIESTPIKPTTTEKNEDIGEFRMGSTIVLVFDAPAGSKFAVDVNDKVKVGRRLLQ